MASRGSSTNVQPNRLKGDDLCKGGPLEAKILHYRQYWSCCVPFFRRRWVLRRHTEISALRSCNGPKELSVLTSLLYRWKQ